MVCCLVIATLLATAPVGQAERPVLPKPTYANSFCLFPIHEGWHLRKPEDRERLTRVVEEMRSRIGPERLYAHLGVAVISEGSEYEGYELARDLGIGLVLQGGCIEHHSHAWGFRELLHDPERGDRRFAQWFQDGLIAEPGQEDQWDFGVRACSSRYAEPVYELRRQKDQARAERVAKAMRAFPETVLACSGPIECEMHQGDRRWGDYSPFTVAEFRDYLTHQGIYAPGGDREGLGYPGGEVFADDPSPAEARGDRPTFNSTFGTRFSTWTLRYWDPAAFPERVPLEAPGMPGPGAKGHVPGGFDAPRVPPGEPEPQGIPREGNDRFWEAWASMDDGLPGFRAKLLNSWVRDHTRWLAEAGVPRDRIFSHQIPGESYGRGRLTNGASAVWTADTPSGSIGITTYFGAASDVDVFTKILARNENWGIFEYHPHPINALDAPVEEYLRSLQTCVRFRAHILTPISWPNEGKDFIVSTGPFAEAMKQVMASLPDQPYYNRSYVDYAPPPVSDVRMRPAGDGTRVSWSELIWPDRRFRWTDWREFERFEVRDAGGRTLAATRDCETTVEGRHERLAVVAVKQRREPSLPAIAGLAGHKGLVKWDEAYDFFCDHYRVEAYDAEEGGELVLTDTTRRARLHLPPMARGEVCCRVAAETRDGTPGPFTPRVRVSAPRPGRRIVDLQAAKARIEGSPDTAWRDGSVGGITQAALAQHPPLQGGWARMEVGVKLPAVAREQRLLFVADAGLRDGAEGSDGVIFRVEVDGDGRFEQLLKPDGQWHEVEVDLTGDAGKEVRLALMTSPGETSSWDWAVWGDPQVLLVGPGVAEQPRVAGIVAQGKQVRGRVTLRWQARASDGRAWDEVAGFAGFRVYRGADRDFRPSDANRLGQTMAFEFVDHTFDGKETFYRVRAVFGDGTESPESEAVQYAP